VLSFDSNRPQSDKMPSIRPDAKVAHVFCLVVFIVYFYKLCLHLSYSRTDLQLVHPVHQTFPHFTVCVPDVRFQASSSSPPPTIGHFRSNISVTMVALQRYSGTVLKGNQLSTLKTAQPVPIGMFAMDNRVCDVYHVHDWPGNSFLLLKSRWDDKSLSLLMFVHHESEIWINMWHELPASTLGHQVEFMMMRDQNMAVRSQVHCAEWTDILTEELHCPFDLQNDTNQPIASLTVKDRPTCVLNELYRSCDRHQFQLVRAIPAHVSQVNFPYLNLTIPHDHFGVRLQNPLLWAVSNPLLSVPTFFWFTIQLLSTFVGFTLFHELDKIPDALQHLSWTRSLFHHRPGLERILKVCLLIVPLFMYQAHVHKLSWEFQNRALGTRLQIKMATVFVPDFAVSVCVSNEALSRPNVSAFCNASTERRALQGQTPKQLWWAESRMNCILDLPINSSKLYFRRNFCCHRFQLYNQKRPEHLILLRHYSLLLNPFLFHVRIRVPIEIEHLRYYMHTINDVARTEKQQTMTQMLQNRIYIKKYLPGFGCINYQTLNFASRLHCLEHCILQSYVDKYQHIPTYVSFMPENHPQRWKSLPFSDVYDRKGHVQCQPKCAKSDCYWLIFRPNYYLEANKTSMVVPKQTLIVQTQQVLKTRLSEFILQILCLTYFCFGVSHYRLVRALVRRLSSRFLRKVSLLINFTIASLFVYAHLVTWDDHVLVVNTMFTHLTIGHPQSVQVCWNPSLAVASGGPSFLELRRNMRLKYQLTNRTRYEFSFERNSEQFPFEQHLNTSPNRTCFQLFPTFLINFTALQGKQDMLYDIRIPRPAYDLYVGSSQTRWPIFFIKEPSQLTFINIQIEYADAHLCRNYEKTRDELYYTFIKRLLHRLRNSLSNTQQALDSLRTFREQHLLPDCLVSQYTPILMYELDSPSPNVSWYRIINSNLQVKVVYSDDFSISHFIIFLFTILEIFLNITFNHSIMILFSNIGALFKQKFNPVRQSFT
jgi:hypothetical protein